VSNIDVLRQPDVLIAARSAVGEGPVIDHRSGRLCWVDITEGMLYENAGQPHAGSVFALATAASGLPIAPFAG
jgi:hypothetical protein